MNKVQLNLILDGYSAKMRMLNESGASEEEMGKAAVDYFKKATEAMDIVEELS